MRRRAITRGGGSSGLPVRLRRAPPLPGPLLRMTATPQRPCPEETAKMVSPGATEHRRCAHLGGTRGGPSWVTSRKEALRCNDPQPHSTNTTSPRTPGPAHPGHPSPYERPPPVHSARPLPIQHPFPGLHCLPTPPAAPYPAHRSTLPPRKPPHQGTPPPQGAPTSVPPRSAPSAAPCPRHAPPTPSPPRPPPRADWLPEGERRALCLSPISDWWEAEG